MSNIDNGTSKDMNTDMNKGIGKGMARAGGSRSAQGMGEGMGAQSAPFEGMEEQYQDLGGTPGGIRGMASKAGEKIMDTAERQKGIGADYVDGIAEAVRRAAGEFESQAPQAAHYIRYAADQMETMSDSFRRRDMSQMIEDVQSFARRQPTAFLGLSVLAGFAAIRFLRSGAPPSSGRRMSSGEGDDWQDRGAMDDGRFGTASSTSAMPGTGPGSGL